VPLKKVLGSNRGSTFLSKKIHPFWPRKRAKIGTNPAKMLQNKEKQAISEEIDLFSLAAGEGFEVPDLLFFRVIACLLG
jgi:hypothetical protein